MTGERAMGRAQKPAMRYRGGGDRICSMIAAAGRRLLGKKSYKIYIVNKPVGFARTAEVRPSERGFRGRVERGERAGICVHEQCDISN